MAGATTGKASFTLIGELDLVHHSARATLRTSSNISVSAGGQLGGSHTFQRLLVNGVRYDDTETFLLGRKLPPALEGKQWVRVESTTSRKSSETSSTGEPGEAVPGAAKGTPSTGSLSGSPNPALLFLGDVEAADPASIIDQLSEAGATLTSVGNGTVRGTGVHRYRVALHDATDLPPTASIDIAVDAQGRLRESIVDYTMQEGVLHGRQSSSTRFQSDFFDFGAPVHITAPPASEVVTMQALEEALGSSSAPLVGSSSGSSTATTSPIASGPAKLTTPWHVVESGTDGASWRAYEGSAPGWTCYSLELTTTSASNTATVMLEGGTRTNVDGKEATCFADDAACAALLAEVTGDRSLVVGVAAPESHIVVTVLSGRDVVLRTDSAGVFQWSGAPSDAAKALTIDNAGKALLMCTTLPSTPSLTCDPSAQSFVVGQPSP
jgi:hypothetical protein